MSTEEAVDKAIGGDTSALEELLLDKKKLSKEELEQLPLNDPKE